MMIIRYLYPSYDGTPQFLKFIYFISSKPDIIYININRFLYMMITKCPYPSYD